MKARCELHGTTSVVLVVSPEDEHEAMLLELFLRYDENAFHALVERAVNGRVREIILRGERG